MTVTFQIRHIETSRLEAANARGETIDKTDWSECSSWGDGKTAAEEVKRLKAQHPTHTWTIVKHDPTAGDPDWRSREMQRFADGTYRKIEGSFPADVPERCVATWGIRDRYYLEQFAGRSIHDRLLENSPTHFAHIAQNDARKVAFTKDWEKGRKDIQTVLSGMEYASRYLGWPEPAIDLFMEALGGYNVKLLFAETAEDMVAVYREADKSREVGSCMTHSTSDYATDGIHPVEAYAAGDLQLCYVRTDGDTGEIWGRCLVWPEKKTWGRIYSTNAALMRKALKANGYEKGEDQYALLGAKLKLIKLGNGQIVCPYIDYSTNAHHEDGDDFITIGGGCGNIDASNTDGTATIDSAGYDRYCECCEEGMSDDDLYCVGDMSYCQSCFDRHAFHCADCGEGTLDSECHMAEGDSYCQSCYQDSFTHCEECSDAIRQDDAHYHEASDQTLCGPCNDITNADEDGGATDSEAPPAAPATEAPAVAFVSRTGFDLEQYVGLEAHQIDLELSEHVWRFEGQPILKVERNHLAADAEYCYRLHFRHSDGSEDSYSDVPRDARLGDGYAFVRHPLIGHPAGVGLVAQVLEELAA